MSHLEDINPEECSLTDLRKWFKYVRSKHTVAWKKAVASVEDFMDSPTSFAMSECLDLIGKADVTEETYQYWTLCISQALREEAGGSGASDSAEPEAEGYKAAADDAAAKMRGLKKKFRASAEAFEETLKARTGAPPASTGPPSPAGWSAKSVDILKPERAHLKLTAIEFSAWKKSALGWGELSHFAVTSPAGQQLYFHQIVEQDFLDKMTLEDTMTFADCVELADTTFMSEVSMFVQ